LLLTADVGGLGTVLAGVSDSVAALVVAAVLTVVAVVAVSTLAWRRGGVAAWR
jgi:hypothetical protein